MNYMKIIDLILNNFDVFVYPLFIYIYIPEKKMKKREREREEIK